MLASKITKRSTDYKSKEDVVPVLSREFNLLVDDVLAAEESSDISLKANIAAPTFTGVVTIPATGLTFTSNGVLVKAGAHSVTLTSTATTNVTLPTSGTLVASASPTFSGTVTIPATGLTFTSNGSLIKAGAHAVTLTSTATTDVTLPTTGTLATLAGAETLSGKTLTEPKFADLGFIADASGNEMLAFDSVATAVNYLQVSNSATLGNLSIEAKGSDTDISISYSSKGAGVHRFQEQSATGDVIAIAPKTGGANSFTGTITSADLTADVTWTLPAATATIATSADVLLTLASPTFTGTVDLPDVTMTGHKNAQLMIFNVFNCPLPATDWVPSATGCDLPASLTAKKMWIPLNGLKVGDEIVDYYLVGDATEAAALTLDCKLTSISKGDPLSVADIAGGGITQITADGVFDSVATLSAAETVAVDTAYALEVLGTTGAGDSIRVCHAMVTVNRK